ncbi:MAG: hypothetical protein QOD80_631, partial [Verrucomicrobiota bacterium]
RPEFAITETDRHASGHDSADRRRRFAFGAGRLAITVSDGG